MKTARDHALDALPPRLKERLLTEFVGSLFRV